jgi:hypothetical protein
MQESKETQNNAKSQTELVKFYRNNAQIRDYIRIFYTCKKLLPKYPEIGTAVCIDSDPENQYTFAGWQMREIYELGNHYCLNYLEKILQDRLGLYLATKESGLLIIQAMEQLESKGEKVELSEEEFKELDKKYIFSRS